MSRSWWTRAYLRGLAVCAAFSVAALGVPCAETEGSAATSRDEAPLSSFLSALSLEALPLAGGSATPLLNPIKAGASHLGPDEIASLQTFLERPTDLSHWVDVGDRFRIHYDAEGLHAPLMLSGRTYVAVAAEACRHVADLYHGAEQRWPQPLRDSDGGDERIDVYVVDLGPGVYGYSLHEDVAGTSGKTGFIVMDNDFAGLPVTAVEDAVRLTIAHEYHHLIQFSYGYDAEATWFMEQLATMEEGVAYPTLRQRERYLPVFLHEPHRSLDLGNGTHEYGTWLWPEFLRRVHDWALLRDAWETWRDEGLTMITAIGVSLDRAGSTLDEAYLEWAIWNGCLGADGPDHYGEAIAGDAGVYPEEVIDQYPFMGWRPDLTRQPDRLGTSYVELRPQAGSADNVLMIVMRSCESLAGVRLLLWTADGTFAGAVEPDAKGLQQTFRIESWMNMGRALLVVANGSGAQYSCNYTLMAQTRYETASVSDDYQSGLGLSSAPNPFEPFTVIQFELPRTEDVSLRIYDAQGRRVISLMDGPASGDRHAIYWGGRDEGGRPVPAGIYYGRLEFGNETRQIKLIRMR